MLNAHLLIYFHDVENVLVLLLILIWVRGQIGMHTNTLILPFALGNCWKTIYKVNIVHLIK